MAVARWWVRWSWAIRAANGESRGKVVGGGGGGGGPMEARYCHACHAHDKRAVRGAA